MNADTLAKNARPSWDNIANSVHADELAMDDKYFWSIQVNDCILQILGSVDEFRKVEPHNYGNTSYVHDNKVIVMQFSSCL